MKSIDSGVAITILATTVVSMLIRIQEQLPPHSRQLQIEAEAL